MSAADCVGSKQTHKSSEIVLDCMEKVLVLVKLGSLVSHSRTSMHGQESAMALRSAIGVAQQFTAKVHTAHA